VPLTAGWTEWADGLASVAQALAIVVGGFWAYFKFLRGRTFAARAELAVAAAPLPGEPPALRVTATLRNTGLSKLPLRTQAVLLYGIVPQPTEDDPVAVVERKLGKAKKILAAHHWVEAGETIADETVLLLPPPEDRVAWRVECLVYERRRRPGGLRWSASVVVPAAPGTGTGEET
jgi:hypothetical protein